jgi:hypothetical protein
MPVTNGSLSFSFSLDNETGIDSLPSLVREAAQVIASNDVSGPYTVVITVTSRAVQAKPEPVTEAGTVDRDGTRRAWCMGSAPHSEHEFNGGDWCPGLTEVPL